MMKKRQQHPSYLVCVERALSRSSSPLSVDDLIERVKAERPVGKGVRSQIYQALNRLYQAIPVEPGRYGWLSTLLKGQTFRHTLTSFELRQGVLLLDELEHAVFFPQFFQSHAPDSRIVHLQLLGGGALEVQATIVRGTWALRLGDTFQKWVDEVGGAAHDSLLIHVEDAVGGVYTVRLQPRESRREQEVLARNVALAQAAEEIIAGDRKVRTAVPVWELAAMLIGRGLFTDPTPPDDMHYVLHEYTQLQLLPDGYAKHPVPYSSTGRSARRDDWALTGAPAPPWLDAGDDPMGPDFFEMDIPFEEEDPFGEDVYIGDDFGPYFPEGFAAPGGEDLFYADDKNLFGIMGDEADLFMQGDTCESYETYLQEFEALSTDEPPLSHMDFHLLEAELEMLVGLEQEFGYLMPEQEARKQQLAAQLFIDPDLFFGGDWDEDWDSPDWEPPFPGF